jgi:acetate kinase
VLLLTVNAGSATIKLDLLEADGDAIERVGHRGGPIDAGNPQGVLAAFLAETQSRPAAIVHRIVHGGLALPGPAIVDRAVEEAIAAAVPLAPLHNPRGLAWLKASRDAVPDAVRIAIPDTGFFAGLPVEASRYALPRALSDELGLRRYGFHGIAHAAMLEAWRDGRLDAGRGSRVITLQLGSGCSIAAIRDGRPIDISMGFTPLEGLVMATRSGDVDPGIIVYLMRERGMTADEIDRTLNDRSGLAGLAGSGDIRDVLAADTAEAEEAIAIFCYRARKYVGAYLAALGGADAVLFGGGIGEGSARIRSDMLAGLEWAGIRVDAVANASIGAAGGRFDVGSESVELHVIAVDEARHMGRLALPLLQRR